MTPETTPSIPIRDEGELLLDFPNGRSVAVDALLLLSCLEAAVPAAPPPAAEAAAVMANIHATLAAFGCPPLTLRGVRNVVAALNGHLQAVKKKDESAAGASTSLSPASSGAST